MTTTKRIRRNVEKQETVVAALHALIRQNDAARIKGLAKATSHPRNGPAYTWDVRAVDTALMRIMETFGYVVTEIQ